MKHLDQVTQATAPLLGRVPQSYFQGIRSNQLCLPDNIVVFLRSDRETLNQRNFESRPHHRHVLIVNCMSAGSVSVDGAVYHLHPGEAFLIAPFQFHFYLEVQHPSISWLFLTFETATPGAFASFVNQPIALDTALLQQAAMLAQLYCSLTDDDRNSSNELVLSAGLFLTHLRRKAQNDNPPLARPIPAAISSGTLIPRINRLLYDRLAEGIGIQELGQRLAVSESHLRKRFKNLTGLSLGSYLVHYKLNRAVKLLVHSEASLSQIAVECGYESLAAFSRSFKSRLGVTPSQYRRNANP